MRLHARANAADVREFYAKPATLTVAGRHTSALERLPDDVPTLVRVAQGLVVHAHMASAYGFAVPDERRWESHIRHLDRMLDRILELQGSPFTTARPVERRLIGVCRHFAVLLVGMLRTKGIPARARCGFGRYFTRGKFEDHWVCEYWSGARERWVLADPQFDELWIRELGIEHDVLDVPRDQFLVAGDAWALCRSGGADPGKFGIGDLRGLWFVAGDVVHDIAALNGMEMLAWDVWGAMPQPDDPMNEDQLAFFDWLAALSRTPDESFGDLRAAYDASDGLRVPEMVFNAILNRPERV